MYFYRVLATFRRIHNRTIVLFWFHSGWPLIGRRLADPRKAILRRENALATIPVSHPDRAGRLNNLGNDLSARFERTGALEDLQKAIRHSEEAVAAIPVDHADRAGMLGNLGAHLSTLFDRTGALRDLQEAIRRSEESVPATPVGHPNRSVGLSYLGTYTLRVDSKCYRGAMGDQQFEGEGSYNGALQEPVRLYGFRVRF